MHPEIIGRAGDTDIVAILRHDGLDLVEDGIGIGLRPFGRLRDLRHGLRQVSHHDRSILAPLGHLMEIDEDLRVAMVETDFLREEHRGVAVGVERQHTVVHAMGLTVTPGLSDKPPEERQTILQTFRMPLHTEDWLILRTLHGLDDAIGRGGDDTELITGVIDSLVVEGVDGEGC